MSCRLVIFEGIMGSGKSTAAREFGGRLAQAGVKVHAFLEGADPHPVRASDDLPRFFEPWRDATPAKLASRSREKWERYVAQRLADSNITVMDGQLFHGDLTHLFLMEMPLEELRAHVGSLLLLLAPLDPFVAYFFQADVERAIHSVCEDRGEKWLRYQVDWKLQSPYATRRGLSGVEGLVTLYREYRALTDLLFEDLACRKLALDTTAGDWTGYEELVAASLDEAGIPL